LLVSGVVSYNCKNVMIIRQCKSCTKNVLFFFFSSYLIGVIHFKEQAEHFVYTIMLILIQAIILITAILGVFCTKSDL